MTRWTVHDMPRHSLGRWNQDGPYPWTNGFRLALRLAGMTRLAKSGEMTRNLSCAPFCHRGGVQFQGGGQALQVIALRI